MIGTGHELLYYFTYVHDAKVKLGLKNHQELTVRRRALEQNYSEEALAEMLTKIGCRKLRDAYVVPAVLESKIGRRYDERTVLFAIKQEDYPEFDIAHIQRRIKTTGFLPNTFTIKRIKRRGHFKEITPRITLPSVWEYDPLGMSGVRTDFVDRIIQTM